MKAFNKKHYILSDMIYLFFVWLAFSIMWWILI